METLRPTKKIYYTMFVSDALSYADTHSVSCTCELGAKCVPLHREFLGTATLCNFETIQPVSPPAHLL